jgi:hypothetical protein
MKLHEIKAHCSYKCLGESKASKLDIEDVIRLYKLRYTLKQIGQKYNVSPKPIVRVLKRNDIPLRNAKTKEFCNERS